MEERSLDGELVLVFVFMVEVEVVAGALDGVFAAEGVEGVGETPMLSLSSPYSFHSSISLRSCYSTL